MTNDTVVDIADNNESTFPLKALVTGMSQALVNRRGSAKNQGLMKSLMAAISKERRCDSIRQHIETCAVERRQAPAIC